MLQAELFEEYLFLSLAVSLSLSLSLALTQLVRAVEGEEEKKKKFTFLPFADRAHTGPHQNSASFLCHMPG